VEKIHRLTSTYPNNRDSPFYGQPLKPMAKLVISKNKEACTTDSGESDSSENSPSTEELVSMMKKKMMMQKKLGRLDYVQRKVKLNLLKQHTLD
jgi:hypothetical protein